MRDNSELRNFHPKEDVGGCEVPRLRTRDMFIVAFFSGIRIMTLKN